MTVGDCSSGLVRLELSKRRMDQAYSETKYNCGPWNQWDQWDGWNPRPGDTGAYHHYGQETQSHHYR